MPCRDAVWKIERTTAVRRHARLNRPSEDVAGPLTQPRRYLPIHHAPILPMADSHHGLSANGSAVISATAYVLFYALVGFASPVALTATLLVIRSERPRTNGIAFLTGFLVGTALTAILRPDPGTGRRRSIRLSRDLRGTAGVVGRHCTRHRRVPNAERPAYGRRSRGGAGRSWRAWAASGLGCGVDGVSWVRLDPSGSCSPCSPWHRSPAQISAPSRASRSSCSTCCSPASSWRYRSAW